MIAPMVSTMTGKLEGIPAINTNPLTNMYCLLRQQSAAKNLICKSCYSVRALKSHRKNCNLAWARNGQLMSMNNWPVEKFVTMPGLFRFNAHGELLNETHLNNIMIIASNNPHTQFALWSKRTDLINRATLFDKQLSKKPLSKGDNLVFVFSSPYINKEEAIPEGFDKVFTVYDKTEAQNVEINCGNKKCMDCQVCYKHDSGVTHIREQIK